MKTKINLLLVIFAVAVMVASCTKDSLNLSISKENKNLLSKISGTIQSTDPNFFPGALNLEWTYAWDNNPGNFGPNRGSFQGIYSYGKNQTILQDSFLNKGHYDFTYHESLPDKVIDNSFPGRDFGYWQFYFNSIHQVSKIGLAFSAASQPSSFEYYNYNSNGELNNFVFAAAGSDTLMKVAYKYDGSGNLTEFDIYLPQGNPHLPPGVSALNPTNGEGLKQVKNSFVESGRMAAFNRKVKENNPTTEAFQPDAATSVHYVLYLVAKVTTDNKPNPFSQQANIFYYQTNRYVIFGDPYEYFISLMKSNPVKIEYRLPVYGDISPSATQTFSYTYNSAGYPVTIHEERNDPLGDFLGSYTKDTRLEYVKNK